jgi:RNA polymerase sigma factor (sigma-70 family)
MEKLLTFEQVAPHLHKWAKILSRNRFDPWELINSAWAYGEVRLLPQSKIRLASNLIKCDMIDYIRTKTRHRMKLYHKKRGNHYPKILNFSEMTREGGRPFEDTIAATREDIEQKDLIEFIINRPDFTRKERFVLKLIYMDGLTQDDASRACGISASRISQIHTNLIERLKTVDYSKAI